MKAHRYIEEPDDLIASRAKEARDHREFLGYWAMGELRLGWSRDVFSTLWDVKETA